MDASKSDRDRDSHKPGAEEEVGWVHIEIQVVWRSCVDYFRVPSVHARLKRASDEIIDQVCLLELDATTARRNGHAAHMHMNYTLALVQCPIVEYHCKAYVVSDGL